VAVYLILEDVWYIIPAKIVRGQWAVWLCPNLSNAKYEPYREAWHLLRGESAKSGRVRSIQACAEEQMVSHVWEGHDFSRADKSLEMCPRFSA
jgi:hypothetical protein